MRIMLSSLHTYAITGLGFLLLAPINLLYACPVWLRQMDRKQPQLSLWRKGIAKAMVATQGVARLC
jgi:hypothetical protein